MCSIQILHHNSPKINQSKWPFSSGLNLKRGGEKVTLQINHFQHILPIENVQKSCFGCA
jgi:hypothetical protein